MLVRGHHFDGTLSSGSKAWRLGPNPLNTKICIWNLSSSYKMRFTFGQGEPNGSQGGVIFPNGGDEFANNQDELILVADASAGVNAIPFHVYVETMVPGTGRQ